MREIKFRQRIGDQWHYWGFLEDGAFTGIASICEPSYQYIGFCDRNGEEIYEGSVIGIMNRGRYCVRGEVVFKRGSFCLKWFGKNVRRIKGEKYSESMPANLGRSGSPWEIVSDTCENPELLEDQGLMPF